MDRMCDVRGKTNQRQCLSNGEGMLGEGKTRGGAELGVGEIRSFVWDILCRRRILDMQLKMPNRQLHVCI